MEKRTIRNVPTLPEVRRPGEHDDYLVCDLPGLASAGADAIAAGFGIDASKWTGNMGTAQSVECIRSGNLAGVAASDAFLNKLEDMNFVSPKYRTFDDVVGSFPNVPNFIAGVPPTMRRRIKQTSAVAPLAVFADLTSSAGISAKHLAARGAAILALVRVLSNLRPVELWATCGMGGPGAAWICCRIETAPLDLARAAHVLTSPSVPRAVMYQIATHLFNWTSGQWPYYNVGAAKQHGAAIMRRVVEPASDVLYVPPIFLTDKSVTDPAAWIHEQVAAYGGRTVAAA